MKKNIAIIAGGDSSEYVISVKSAAQIEKIVDKKLYNVFTIIIHGTDWKLKTSDNTEIQIDKNDFSINFNGEIIKFECALILIHGTPGEDGKLQAYFELLKIPYTTCNVLTSSLTFNKFFCKTYLNDFGILSPKAIILRKKDKYSVDSIIEKIGLPCFIKPNNGGSSFGISKVADKKDIAAAINKAFNEDDEIIIEEFIEGTEITCGLVKIREKEYIFPLTEIISKNEFFDYEAKYTDGMADEITPARISNELEIKCKKISSEIYDVLGCYGIVRVDFILKDKNFYFIEINTVPGMTANSIVPQQIKTMGLSMKEMITLVIEDAIGRKQK
ncbi:MAG: D-alanine--D-alanine ligase [Bacteroidales bacterium]|nr:D-alanine--D-alanine ligase [Bacteroidales bacterium]